jgi:hypothetical protein
MNANNRPQSPISPGSGVSGIGGAILTLMFFLPWFSACGVNVSGKDLAFGITVDAGMFGRTTGPAAYPWLALVLLCGIAAVIIALLALFQPSISSRMRSFLMIGTGGAACFLMGIVLLGYVNETSNSVNVIEIEIGFPGALIGALMIAGGAVLDLMAVAGGRARAPGFAPGPPVHSAPVQWQSQPTAPPISPPVGQNRARVHFRSGALAGQSVEVSGDGITIGRSAENHIRIPDTMVSRLHAVIRYAQGRYFLQDQQSTHGILLNGQPIQASVLNDGDVITIGDSEFEFRVQ